MIKEQEVRARLSRVLRCGHSDDGNPHFDICVKKMDGTPMFGQTKVNAKIGYAIRGAERGPGAPYLLWKFHKTDRGRIIFDFVEA